MKSLFKELKERQRRFGCDLLDYSAYGVDDLARLAERICCEGGSILSPLHGKSQRLTFLSSPSHLLEMLQFSSPATYSYSTGVKFDGRWRTSPPGCKQIPLQFPMAQDRLKEPMRSRYPNQAGRGSSHNYLARFAGTESKSSPGWLNDISLFFF
jgi:hypothetical protein